MRCLAPLALGLAAAATTNNVLFVHVGKTCGGSAVAWQLCYSAANGAWVWQQVAAAAAAATRSP